MRRILALVAAWVVATALAVATGLLAVTRVGDALTGEQTRPMSPPAVERALDAEADEPPEGTPSTTRTPGSSRTSAGGVATRTIATPGGTVVARCHDARVRVVSWTPDQGFEVEDDVVTGPRRTAYLRFESEELDVDVTIDCRDGVPVEHTVTRKDD